MHPILKKIRDRYVTGYIINIKQDIIDLLLKHGYKIRQDDGNMIQINLSFPASDMNELVIGLRYMKKDSTYTEDHFICSKNEATCELIISPYYKGSIEKAYPEYRGTHKYHINDPLDKENIITRVNTITHWLKKK